MLLTWFLVLTIQYTKLTIIAEKYTGTGTSIKKAQHSAAKKVIDNCETLDRPKYKPKRPKSINMDALTPTVKLNGLAMKRGEMAIYKILDRKPMYNNQQYNSQVWTDIMLKEHLDES